MDIVRRIKRCRPAIEVFLRHGRASDKKMIKNSRPQIEKEQRKNERRCTEFEGCCMQRSSEAKGRGRGNTQQNGVSSDIVGLSARSSFTQSLFRLSPMCLPQT